MKTDVPTTVKNKKLVEKRRNQLIQAATKLFSAHGFHKSTMRDLAEEAGLSHANIYDYIGTKEDIFFLLHDVLAGSAMEILKRYIDSASDPAAKLRNMVRGEFRIMDRWSDALLLIYQESHILSRPRLKELLAKERYHLELFEVVIEECIQEGYLKACNVRLLANLVKMMIDSWALKRWDYRGHVEQLEAEKMVLDIIFNGLLRESPDSPKDPGRRPDAGKTACVSNAGTIIGRAVAKALADRGYKVIVHGEPWPGGRDRSPPAPESAGDALFYNRDEVGDLSPDLLNKMETEAGPIEVFIQDLGLGPTRAADRESQDRKIARLNEHLVAGQAAARYLETHLPRRGVGRVLFITPWAWDGLELPMPCATITAGVEALTKSLARALARYDVTVNCLVPGYIKTVRPSKSRRERSREVLGEIPAQRLGDIEEIIHTALFLIDDSSRYVTGQKIAVNGGINL